MQAPVVVLNTNAERESGRKAQLSNIEATKTVSDIVRTCLGPRAMLKMLLDPMGGIVLTNDGNAILREIEVAHPAAKSMLELCRSQDEEVGDGTTSVIILAGEILSAAAPLLEQNIHPITIISGYKRALEDALSGLEKFSRQIDIADDSGMLNMIKSSLGTKLGSRWNDLICEMALRAVRCVAIDDPNGPVGKKEVDIKRYVRIEKIPGGEIEESRFLNGVVLNKDICHANMRRRIDNPRIILLDCNLEYKKGESQTNIEISREGEWSRYLEIEESQIREMCDYIIDLKPDLILTEKGISDLAQHFLMKANISAIRRIKKSDANRIARATGATIVNRVEDLKESDVGLGCGSFRIEKIGDEYFSFLDSCKNPKACTLLLRGPSKDILNELDRNLQDALADARNIYFYPRLCAGGGATEMALSVLLDSLSNSVQGTEKLAYKAIPAALQIIPRTLCQNCGADPVRLLSQLRAKHAANPSENFTFGIDGINGTIINQAEPSNIDPIWEPFVVKAQSLKTAIESACMVLRVDDIVSGITKSKSDSNADPSASPI